MRLSQLFFFVAAASASPFASPKDGTNEIETRQGSNLAVVILDSVNNAAAAVDVSLATTQQTIQTAGNNVNVQVQALIEANLAAIATALTNASQTISGAITTAGGNIANAVAAFTVGQIDQIVLAVGQLIKLLTSLGASLEVIITGLENVAPAVLKAVQDELALIQATINPFVAPIVNVADAAAAVSASVRVVLTGFTALTPGLITIVTNVVNNV